MGKYQNVYNNVVKIEGIQEIEKLRSALSVEREESDRLRTSLNNARSTVQDLYNQIDDLKSSTGIDVLEQALAKFKSTAMQSVSEFRTFLQTVNLNDEYGSNDNQFEHLFERIEEGSMTAQQAILRVKTEFQALMEENYKNGGAFDTQQVQTFIATLNRLSETVDSVVASVSRIGQAAGLGDLKDGVLSAISGVRDAADSIRGAIEPISAAFKAQGSALSEMGKEGSASLNQVLEKLNAINTVVDQINGKNFNVNIGLSNKEARTEQLASIKGQMMETVNAVNDAQKMLGDAFIDKSLRKQIEEITGINLSSVIGQLYQYNDAVGKLQSSIKQSGSFAELQNVSQTIEKVTSILAPSLDALNRIKEGSFDMSRFALPDFSKAKEAADSASQLKNVLQELGVVSKASEEVNAQSSKAFEEEREEIASLSKTSKDHEAAMEAAAEAERQKQEISGELGGALKEEAYSTDEATESATQHDRALKTVIDTLTSVQTKMHDLAGKEGGTSTDEYVQLQELETKLTELRDNADTFSAKHIYDEMAKLQLGFSEAKQGANLFSMGVKDSASEAKSAYDQLLATIKEIGGKELTLAKLDPEKNANEIELLETAITNLKAKLEELRNTDGAEGMTSAQLDKLDAAIKQTEQKLEQLRAKQIDVAQTFASSLSVGKAGVEYQTLIEKFQTLSTVSPKLAAAMKQLQDAQAVLTSDSSSVDQKVQAYRDYTAAIGDVKSMLDQEYAAEQRKIVQDKKVAELEKDIASAKERLESSSRRTKDALDTEMKGILRDLEALKSMDAGDDKQAEIDRLIETLRRLKGELDGVEKTSTTANDQLTSRFVYMFSLANVLMKTVSAVKEMIKTSVELDTAMTQLRVVTNETEAAYSRYGSAVAKTAREIGVSIADMIDSTTVFARLGYSLEDSAALSKYTTMLSNVGAIDVSSAQNALTAITKAFGISADEIEATMDKMVVVGNNFPISVAEIAEGMNNAGSALAAAGNSFEQSVALLTAANTTIQNVSKASTGLRTITARIRNTTVELDELGEAVETAKYEKVISLLTDHNVALTTANGEYRTTYDILSDIADVWGELSSMEQAAVAQQLAGTRQQNIFFSIIEQFQEASKAMKAMGDSSGELSKAYGKELESVQVKVNQLKAVIQDLSQNLFDSNALGRAVDIGTNFMDLIAQILEELNEARALIPIIASLLAGVLANAIKKVADMWATGIGFNWKAAAIIAALATIAAIIGGIKQDAEEARAYAAQAANEVANLRSQRESAAESSIKRIQELKEKIDSGKLSSDELYGAQQELIDIKDGLVDALGEEADQINLLGENAENTASKIRSLNRENARLEAGNNISANEIEIRKITDSMESVRDDWLAPKTIKDFLKRGGYQNYIEIPTAEYTLSGRDYLQQYEQLAEIVKKFESFSIEKVGDSFRLKLTGDIYDAQSALNGFTNDLRHLMDEDGEFADYIGGGYGSTRFIDSLSNALSQVNNTIKENESTYEEYILERIYDSDKYSSLLFSIEDARYAYEDAVSAKYATEEEKARAISDALDALSDVKVGIDDFDFGNDKGIKKYILKLFDDIDKEIAQEENNRKFRLALDLDIEVGDGLYAKHRDKLDNVISGLLKNFSDEATGEIYLKDIQLVGQQVELMGDATDEMNEQQLAYYALNKIAEQYGYTLDDMIVKLSNYGRISIDNLSVTQKTINSITGLSEKLDGATDRIGAFNEAMKGGEKGDTAKEYAKIYDQFIRDWDAGKTGSNAVSAAISTFLSPDAISKYEYDIGELGKILSGDMYKAIFTDGEEYGRNFANYLKDIYGDAVDGIYSIEEDGDGGFSISISSFEKLAEFLEMDTDLFYSLVESMDLWGTEIMHDAGMLEKLASDFNLIGENAPTDKVEQLEAAISGLYDKGAKDPVQIMNMLKMLDEAGYIDLDIDLPDGENVSILIEKILSDKNELEQKGATITLNTNAPEVYSEISALKDLIDSVSGVHPITFVTSSTSGTLVKGPNEGLSGKLINMESAGTKNAPGGPTLVNELGPELIAENGEAYIANDGKPAVVDLSQGAIVLDAEDTKDALKARALTKMRSASAGIGKDQAVYDDGGGGGYNGRRCKNCGALCSKDALFCYRCGAPLVGPAAKFGPGGDDDKSSDSGSGGNGSGGTGGSGSGDNWFERQYAEHKHLVEMDKESTKDFLDWLDDAYKRAYEEGIIDLKEYRQHEEEVYKGRQNDFKDYLSDLEHLISMEENGDNNPTVIYNYYVQMIADIEKELEKAYADGLDATNDYVQYLQNAWYKYSKEIEKQQEDANKEAKKQVKDLVDYRIKMLKQYLKNEIQTLKDRLSYLKDFYSKQKSMLQEERDQEKYIDEQAEKRKAVSDIQAELAQLENDNSAWAQKRKKKLQEELAKAQKALEDFEKDHALKVAQDELDAIYEAQEDSINTEIDALQEKLDNPQYLYEQALEDIRNNSVALYEEMIEFNNKYGTGIREDIVDMWEEAYISLKRYFDLFNEYYKGIDLVNATGYVWQPSDDSIIVTGGGYASGTSHAKAGLHRVDELGAEYVFTSKGGGRYRMLGDGDKVLNADSTNFLYRFATSGRKILSQLLGGIGYGSLALAGAGGGVAEIRMGDIIIQGNADERTISEIRRAQRDGINTILKEFSRLKK